jgi:hypothetical protein
VKKENTVFKVLRNKVTIAERVIDQIFFDLKHIQYGWDQERRDYKAGPARNNYTEDDIVDLFEQLNTLVQIPIEQKVKKKSVEHRFIFYIYDGDKRLKMVVDLMKNDATVVVTIH